MSTSTQIVPVVSVVTGEIVVPAWMGLTAHTLDGKQRECFWMPHQMTKAGKPSQRATPFVVFCKYTPYENKRHGYWYSGGGYALVIADREEKASELRRQIIAAEMLKTQLETQLADLYK